VTERSPSTNGEFAKIAFTIGAAPMPTRSFTIASRSLAKSRFAWTVAGLLHHAVPERAHPRHVLAHDPVALLRHPRDVVELAHRVAAESEEPDPHVLADGHQLAHVTRHLDLRGMHRVDRRARELDLAARLEA
jgi:hypothetical protein